MAPESPHNLIALDLAWNDAKLEAEVDRLEGVSFLNVSWNAIKCPEDYLSIGRGVAYVSAPQGYTRRQYRARVSFVNDGFEWIDFAQDPYGAMFILELPFDHVFVIGEDARDQGPTDFKCTENGRMALYWWRDPGRFGTQWRMRYRQRAIQLTVTHLTRYTDALRVQRPMLSDRGRYSLDTLLNTKHLADLSGTFRRAPAPVPRERWMALRKEFVEWPMLLSLRFPQLRSLDERVVRLPQGGALQGIDPPISPGSLILLEEISGAPEIQSDTTKTGWSRRVYALRRGTDLLCGYLDRNDNRYVLLAGAHGAGEAISVHQDELHLLSHISGVAVPI